MYQKAVENSMDEAWEQVYKMAGTESELLNHIKSRKLRYFWAYHEITTRQH